jgi:hypothetical protein
MHGEDDLDRAIADFNKAIKPGPSWIELRGLIPRWSRMSEVGILTIADMLVSSAET